MFDNLQDKMDRVFKTLRGEGSLNEWHIDNALKEIRVALLEADVNFKVVRQFTNRVREKAVGQEVLTAFSPAQQVTKIVRDELQTLLGGNEVGLALVGSPAVVMMVGLQGSGKTTTSGKLALHLKNRGRRPLLVPCDVYRPAAIEQLRVVANNVKVPFFEIEENRDPVKIANDAIRDAKTLLYDTVILDTAGRLHIDEELMQELTTIKNDVRPSEILFVADAMTGQDAVKSAKEFDDRLGVTGIVLTKLDGDDRGGAARGEGQVHARGPPLAAPAGQENGATVADRLDAAGRQQGERRGHRRERDRAHAGDPRLDDQARARAPAAHQRLAQEAHRQGLRHDRAGDQTPPQAIPADEGDYADVLEGIRSAEVREDDEGAAAGATSVGIPPYGLPFDGRLR